MRADFEPDPALYPFERRFFESRAGKIHYVDDGDGPPILLCHGNPTWSFLYRNIIDGLRGRFRCIAPDYPGFGLSDHPSRYGYTAAEHADVVAELVDHLGLEDLVVMGQDWGGPIGTSVAARAPERIRGLVMGNTWFWPTDRRMNEVFSWVMSRPLKGPILKRGFFVERLIPMGTNRKLSKREMDHYRGVQPSPAFRRGTLVFPRQLVEAGPWLAELADRVPGALGDKPLELVWGMKDFAFTPGHFLPRWKETFPDHRLVELPRAKHFIQEDAPDAIADAILDRFG